jgi:hypothetical protein
MFSEMDLAEYMEEVREQVCSRCIERPPGGPPCEPLGKICGIELHFPELIDSIHQVKSSKIAPYLERNRREICTKCAFQHSSFCACPMDYLLPLIVEAVETVDARRKERGLEPPERARRDEPAANLDSIRRAYRKGRGTWTGCDWRTQFGSTGLDLKGWTAARAKKQAEKLMGTPEANDWIAAVNWLLQVEDRARQAEAKAKAAVVAAEHERWEEALRLAEWAWALEFSTGRPVRNCHTPAWRELCDEVESAALAHTFFETV